MFVVRNSENSIPIKNSENRMIVFGMMVFLIFYFTFRFTIHT